jgi:hypothetical protein
MQSEQIDHEHDHEQNWPRGVFRRNKFYPPGRVTPSEL